VNSHNMQSTYTNIELNGSGNLVVGSTFVYDWSNGYFGLTVSLVNTQNHNIVWEKDFYLLESFRRMHYTTQAFKILCLPKDEIIICGTAETRSSSAYFGYKGVVLKLNSNGSSLWTRFYNAKHIYDDCQFNDIVPSSDSGFLAVGFHAPGTWNFGAWLVKMDSLGNAPLSFITGTEYNLLNNNYNFLIYPNPAQNNINLRFKENQKGKLQLEIYNASGQLVMRHQILTFEIEYQVNIGELSSGLYFIKLASNNQILYSSKFIKE